MVVHLHVHASQSSKTNHYHDVFKTGRLTCTCISYACTQKSHKERVCNVCG